MEAPRAAPDRPGGAPPSRGRAGALVALLAFAAIATTTTLRHEMWRDELRAWQAATASATLAELAANIRSEGHPGLWYALLYPLSRFTDHPVAMQLLHLAIAIAGAAVVLFAAPFPLVWRTIAVLGYFPLYEYGAISRNYGLGALLLFGFCAVYPVRGRRPGLAAALLVLLAQTTVYGLILSLALGLMWIADGRTRLAGAPAQQRPPVGALAVWLAGLAASALQLTGGLSVKRPFDPEVITATNRVLDVLAGPWRGLAPFPSLRFNFWDSNLLDVLPDGALVQTVLGLVLVVALAWMFRRRPPLLMLYLGGSTALVAFAFLVYVGHLRHHGHHMLLLLASTWLLMDREAVEPGTPTRRPRLDPLVAVLLVVNLAAGLYACGRDWRDPFSAAREVARSISDTGLSGLPIVGHRESVVAGVGGYLRRPLHHPSVGREASYIPWGAPDRRPVGDGDALAAAEELARRHDSDVLILFSRADRRRPKVLGKAVRIGNLSDAMVASERFELYLLPVAALHSDP
jgi:hypothetical protein